MDREPETMTVKELQTRLGISKPFAYKLVREPGFPAVRAGKKILIPVSGFNDWMRKGGTQIDKD
jgi:excisionase family DNA binding protein